MLEKDNRQTTLSRNASSSLSGGIVLLRCTQNRSRRYSHIIINRDNAPRSMRRCKCSVVCRQIHWALNNSRNEWKGKPGTEGTKRKTNESVCVWHRYDNIAATKVQQKLLFAVAIRSRVKDRARWQIARRPGAFAFFRSRSLRHCSVSTMINASTRYGGVFPAHRRTSQLFGIHSTYLCPPLSGTGGRRVKPDADVPAEQCTNW